LNEFVTDRPDFTAENELRKCNGTVLLDEESELNSLLARGLLAGTSGLYLGMDKVLVSSRYMYDSPTLSGTGLTCFLVDFNL
jgi:hypothetical protein